VRNSDHPARIGDQCSGRPIDKGIARAVRVLQEGGIETIESCQGGDGHSFVEPTVRFCGGHGEGFRGLGIAQQHGLQVSELRRYWTILDMEPVGPLWEMTFVRSAALAEDSNPRRIVRWKRGQPIL